MIGLKAIPTGLAVITFIAVATPALADAPQPLWQRYPLGNTHLHKRADLAHQDTVAPSTPRDGGSAGDDVEVSARTWVVLGCTVVTLGFAAVGRGWTTSSFHPDAGVPSATGTKLVFVGIASAVAVAVGFLISFL
jgi:hypothetical protein